MTEQVWYYARGDVEKGPITGAQIKALAAAGKIRPADFVWKEGMESWTTAAELPELFPTERAQGTPPATAPSPAVAQSKQVRPALAAPLPSSDPVVRPVGHTSLVLGLLVALLARGCDTLASRQVDRLQAIAETSVSDFSQEWQRRRASVEQEQAVLREKASPSPSDQRRLNELNGQLAQLEKTMNDERSQLELGAWLQQRTEARQARREYRTRGFWREATFLLGTVILTAGLLAIGFSGEGPERWICLAMIAAVVFSIYVGGRPFTP